MGPRSGRSFGAELVFPPDHARLFYYLDPACLLRGERMAAGFRLQNAGLRVGIPRRIGHHHDAYRIYGHFQSYRAAMANPADKLGR